MLLLKNKKASFDYQILQKFTAGVVLSGPEVKSLRNKSGSLTGTFVKIIGSEAFLLNAQITPYKYAENTEYDPKRTRKLLLKKKEIAALAEASSQKGVTLVPLAFILAGKTIKLEFGLARGLKNQDRREKIKKRDLDRETKRALKNY